MGGGLIYTGEVSGDSTSAHGATKSFDGHNSLSAFCREPSANDAFAMIGGKRGVGVFGPVPSREEVERAICELQRFINGHSTSEPELDRLQGLLYRDDQSKALQASGYLKLRDAFNTMRTEPSFQNVVISLSSDRAVWEAILSNKAVQDFQGTIVAAKKERLSSCMEEPDLLILIWRWIIGFAKSKVLELVEKFGLLVKEIIQLSPEEKPPSELTNLLEERIRSSFLLSVVITLIVVVARAPS